MQAGFPSPWLAQTHASAWSTISQTAPSLEGTNISALENSQLGFTTLPKRSWPLLSKTTRLTLRFAIFAVADLHGAHFRSQLSPFDVSCIIEIFEPDI